MPWVAFSGVFQVHLSPPPVTPPHLGRNVDMLLGVEGLQGRGEGLTGDRQ